MKKLIYTLAISSLVLFASCKQSSTTEQQAADEQQTTEQASEQADANTAATEAVDSTKIDPFILTQMKADSTVMVTPSGLGYKIIKQTRGITPQPTDVALVNYTGMHTNGEVFDSSNGNPVPFNLQGVIPGFSEGLQLMPVGSTYMLYIPGNLAYGPNGIPQAGIGPNELLVFEVNLVDIQR